MVVVVVVVSVFSTAVGTDDEVVEVVLVVVEVLLAGATRVVTVEFLLAVGAKVVTVEEVVTVDEVATVEVEVGGKVVVLLLGTEGKMILPVSVFLIVVETGRTVVVKPGSLGISFMGATPIVVLLGVTLRKVRVGNLVVLVEVVVDVVLLVVLELVKSSS